MGLFKPKHTHVWQTIGNAFVEAKKVFIVEKCKCGQYHYVRVPSNAALDIMEAKNG